MRHPVRNLLLRNLLSGCSAAGALLLAVAVLVPEALSKEPEAAVCHELTDLQANLLFAEWNNALQEGPDAVTLKYSTGGVLLPTFENGPLVGRAAIRGYFVHFLKKHPVGRIDTRAIVPAGCNIGVVAGLYTFTVDEEGAGAGGEKPPRVDSPARYTYVYTYNLIVGRWEIAHHHSSAQPQKAGSK